MGFSSDGSQRFAENHQALKRSAPFQRIVENSFLKAPKWHMSIDLEAFEDLEQIKHSRARRLKRQRRMIVVGVTLCLLLGGFMMIVLGL